jgi:HsdM N-terminal domain
MSASDISNKVWGYAKVLLDDGVSYNDSVEQLTYLIFLKMAYERQQAGQADNVPKEWSWRKLVKLDGTDLEIQYRKTLEQLGKLGGMLGTIFRKAQNKVQDPAKRERLIKLIDKEEWSTLPADIKGDIYEGLLERNAQDVKGGTAHRADVDFIFGFLNRRCHCLAGQFQPIAAPRFQRLFAHPHQSSFKLVRCLWRIVGDGDHIAAAAIHFILQRDGDRLPRHRFSQITAVSDYGFYRAGRA